MVLLDQALPPLQDVVRTLHELLEGDKDKATLDREAIEKIQKKLTKSAKALNRRLFIVMNAQTEGWQFAKKLDFYESGTMNCWFSVAYGY